MSFFNAISTHFLNTMEKRAAVRVWYLLQSVDARAIQQAGLSAELLAQGPSAFPWRATSNQSHSSAGAVGTDTGFNKKQLRNAAAELRACSDSELRDLGIARGSIEHVVRFGRGNVDQAANDQSQRAA